MSASQAGIDWRGRENKRANSGMLFSLLREQQGTPARNALMLPGPRCLCIREAVGAGVLSKRETRVVAAESNRLLFPEMRETLESMGFERQPRALMGSVQSFDADEFPARVDFAYLDLCGYVDTAMARWMHDVLSPKLAPGARLAVTMTCDGQYRTNEMMKRSRVRFIESPPPAVVDVQSRVPLLGARREMRAEEALGICLVLCTLRHWNVEVCALAPYSDGTRRMLTAVFRVVSPCPEGWWPGIDDVIAHTDWLDFSQFITLDGRGGRGAGAARGGRTRASDQRRIAELDARLAELHEQARRLMRERELVSSARRRPLTPQHV